MKIPQKSILSHLQHFPFEITNITIDYIGDHFMIHRGSYKWKIDKHLLDRMLDADNLDIFKSDTFTMCKPNWQLRAWPNGDETDCEGSFNLSLAVEDMPLQWKLNGFV